jgi:glycerol-3-phosphate O-acyltransferase
MAQRMSVLYGMNSPEFFDKSLFRNFIDAAAAKCHSDLRGWQPRLRRAAAGVAADAQFVLSEQIRHSILQVTLGQ